MMWIMFLIACVTPEQETKLVEKEFPDVDVEMYFAGGKYLRKFCDYKSEVICFSFSSQSLHCLPFSEANVRSCPMDNSPYLGQ